MSPIKQCKCGNNYLAFLNDGNKAQCPPCYRKNKIAKHIKLSEIRDERRRLKDEKRKTKKNKAKRI